MSTAPVPVHDGADPERFQEGITVELGQWYWVKDKDDADAVDGRWFGCVMEVGSNYFELMSPRSRGCTRIHADQFMDLCTREKNPRGVIDSMVQLHKRKVEALLDEIKQLTQKLGVTNVTGIEHQGEARALSTLSAKHQDMKAYKKSLIKAQEKTLPELFQGVKENNDLLARWMSADVLTMEAQVGLLDDCVDLIKERIFHVELYAGLTEDIAQIRGGKPAAREEKLHLMQGRLFMDEECLVDYDAGGMSFSDIKKFDKWLLRPHNLNNLLPFQRCMVAFQVRRHSRNHESAKSLSEAWVQIQIDREDKLTFLYIRNGAQVYRISTEIELRETMFPDQSEFDFSEPLMARGDGTSYRIMTKREHDERLRKEAEADRKHDAWVKANPNVSYHKSPFYDHRDHFNRLESYRPFDKTSVYYDDIKKSIEADMKYYNRVVLILQGLFDRSPVLNPHPPAQLYNGANFQQLVALVYDRDRALHAGPKPDWEVFRTQCNKALAVGSVIIGQRTVWQDKHPKKEYDRYRGQERFIRYPDPGPATISVVTAIRKGKVTCEYIRPRQKATGGKSWRSSVWDRKAPEGCQAGDPMTATFTAPIERVFNISAYTPGDYKLFFADPRTRLEYLKWAPFLLAAEDFHAGKRKASLYAFKSDEP